MSIYVKFSPFRNYLPIVTSTYPGGEEYVRVTDYVLVPVHIDIKAHIKSSADVMKLVMFMDAVDRVASPKSTVYLNIPYMPYARQDRVCQRGESLSIAAFAKILNSLNFDRVVTLDVHSNVTGALINNLVHKDLLQVFPSEVVAHRPLLIAPDAGARSRVELLARKFNLEFIALNKKRHAAGKITFSNPDAPTKGLPEHCLVVDDICDGGATFIELLRGIGHTDSLPKIDLWVTHGIFSKGLKPLFDAGYRNIYTTNSWLDKDVPRWSNRAKSFPKGFADRIKVFPV